MSTYKQRENTLGKTTKQGVKKDSAVKELKQWVSKQKWSTGSISDTVVRGVGGDEITLLIHGNQIRFDDVIKKIKASNFIELGINVKFKSSEKASWNYTTYFLDFTFLG